MQHQQRPQIYYSRLTYYLYVNESMLLACSWKIKEIRKNEFAEFHFSLYAFWWRNIDMPCGAIYPLSTQSLVFRLFKRNLIICNIQNFCSDLVRQRVCKVNHACNFWIFHVMVITKVNITLSGSVHLLIFHCIIHIIYITSCLCVRYPRKVQEVCKCELWQKYVLTSLASARRSISSSCAHVKFSRWRGSGEGGGDKEEFDWAAEKRVGIFKNQEGEIKRARQNDVEIRMEAHVIDSVWDNQRERERARKRERESKRERERERERGTEGGRGRESRRREGGGGGRRDTTSQRSLTALEASFFKSAS